MGEREKEDREVVGKMNGEGEKEGMGWRRRVARTSSLDKRRKERKARGGGCR